MLTMIVFIIAFNPVQGGENLEASSSYSFKNEHTVSDAPSSNKTRKISSEHISEKDQWFPNYEKLCRGEKISVRKCLCYSQ